MSPLVAVCVCTRARPKMLRRCLMSLRRQTLDPTRLRMKAIVVDNNDEPEARPIYEEMCDDPDGTGLVHCPEPGIPSARNAAIDAALRAGADYIAFLDDDEVAPENWIASLVEALRALGADAVQGGVRHHRIDLADDLSDLVDIEPCLTRADAAATLDWEACESLATCNVVLKAHLVRPPLALRFDESMRYTGGSDRELFMRAHKAGARLVRVYGIDVLEDLHEERQALSYQAARAFAAGSNYFARMTKNEPAPVAAMRITMRAVDRSVTGLVKLAIAAALLLLHRRSALRQWRKGCAQLCFAAGCVSPVAGVRANPYRNIQGA